jgi:hypothetical protein
MHIGFVAPLIAISACICEFGPALAETPAGDLELTVSFDEQIPEHPAPLVFVKGELAGIAPGTVMVPKGLEAIEIGIAQLSPSPLYSFTLGPKETAEHVTEVVMSTFEFGASKDHGFWSGLLLNPNIRKSIKLEETKPGSYSMVLPAQPFQSISKYWAARSAELSQRDWFGTVSSANNNSDKSGYSHFGYGKHEGQIVAQNDMSGGAWSGAIAKMSGLFEGYDLPTENWTIISNPSGATIYTDGGHQGSTTSTIRIAKTGSMFIVLKKDGYQQCLLKDCQKSDTKGGVMLTCDLKKR